MALDSVWKETAVPAGGKVPPSPWGKAAEAGYWPRAEAAFWEILGGGEWTARRRRSGGSRSMCTTG
ncbi:hypothetical protein GCM10020367_70560 [Streptomyces sannanensis]|uniref:DUF2510 domain-containing protein n=1 Tax=Streptomyces sannanensis TaxID=285536 RepID=A0ABP6SNR5_9ACTN